MNNIKINIIILILLMIFKYMMLIMVLGEYSLFLEECEKAKVDCIVSRPSYYFALWVNNQYDYFKKRNCRKEKRTNIIS